MRKSGFDFITLVVWVSDKSVPSNILYFFGPKFFQSSSILFQTPHLQSKTLICSELTTYALTGLSLMKKYHFLIPFSVKIATYHIIMLNNITKIILDRSFRPKPVIFDVLKKQMYVVFTLYEQFFY